MFKEKLQSFSIRKLTIGAASVLIGTTFYLKSSGQMVHADTLPENSNPQVEQVSQSQNDEGSISEGVMPAAADSTAPSEQIKSDAQETQAPVSTQQGVDPVKYANNGGYDSSIWGKMDVNDWTLTGDEITDYSGDRTHIIIPNSSDFIKAGKLADGQTAEISSQTMYDLVHNTDKSKATQSIAISLDDNSKIKAEDSDWSYAFGQKYITSSDSYDKTNLSNIQLGNLDVSNVIKMINMFAGNQISDLSSLSNWNVGNVTDMSSMFASDNISDLSSLTNWNVAKVTDMSDMFEHNQISNLSGLANWNVASVADMGSMFTQNQISDLTPLTNWNVARVTDMGDMFEHNQISDLTPLANWNVSKVKQMTSMFMQNQINDLTPLANWDVSNVTYMYNMFMQNQIKDLTPLTNWNVSNTTYMSNMFDTNQISNLSGLANWNVSNVITMCAMFEYNQISDLTPLTNWNVTKVDDMSYMFKNNQITDLSPLASWNATKATDMSYMFDTNQISDLKPLAKWNVTKVAKMGHMFEHNQLSDLTPLANWNVSNVTDMQGMFYNNPVELADFSKWDFSKIKQNPDNIVTGMDDFIAYKDRAVIYVGDNSSLPAWFIKPRATGHSNNNIFTTFNDKNLCTESTVNHLIVTSNDALLKNPNGAFNQVRFSNGDTVKTPAFIYAKDKQSIIDAVLNAVNKVMDEKKAELENADSTKVYTLGIDPSVDQSDPIALINALIDIQPTDKLTQSELSKQIIVYKDKGNYEVVGTQEVNVKPGEKVTPEIPEGYIGDDTPITMPDTGVAIIFVTKKSSSNGDVATANMTEYLTTGSTGGNPDVTPATPANGNPTGSNDSDKDKPHTKLSGEVSNKKNSNKAIPSGYRQSNVGQSFKEAASKQTDREELPQTGENENSTTSAFGMLAIALGSLMGLGVDRKKKRN